MIALVIITILSLAAAAFMSVVAWRLARQERLRSDARVSALAADILGSSDDEASPVAVNQLFAEPPPRHNHGGVLGTLAIGVAAVGAVLLLAVVWSGPPSSREASPAGSAVTQASPSDEVPAPIKPLELMSLTHQREGRQLVVRGTARNPNLAGATPVTAVVTVFDRAGAIVASGHAALAPAASGGASDVESSFAVTIAGVDDVSRYRVGFRTDDHAIAHVDRRDAKLSAQLP
jgi:hypothetical protein